MYDATLYIFFLVIEVCRSNISLQNYFRPEVKSQGRWNWGCRGEGKGGFTSRGGASIYGAPQDFFLL